jgi:hypothetical protein
MTTMLGASHPNIAYFVVFSTKTAFWKLQDIFPECFLYREHTPQVDPLMCLSEDNACHVNHNCMETLVKRINVLFQEVLPTVNVIVLYYRKLNQRYGAGIFWRDMREPHVITFNPSAWQYIKQRGSIFTFSPNSSFFLSGQAAPPQATSEIPALK